MKLKRKIKTRLFIKDKFHFILCSKISLTSWVNGYVVSPNLSPLKCHLFLENPETFSLFSFLLAWKFRRWIQDIFLIERQKSKGQFPGVKLQNLWLTVLDKLPPKSFKSSVMLSSPVNQVSRIKVTGVVWLVFGKNTLIFLYTALNFCDIWLYQP